MTLIVGASGGPSSVPGAVVYVSTKTLLRRLELPGFEAAYGSAKRAAFGQAITRLHHLSSAAVSTLGKVKLDPATLPATKVRASDSILNLTVKAIHIEDFEAGVSALERAAEASKHTNIDPCN